MINFTCPGCQAAFQLPDQIAGKTARCSRCNQRFTVPGGMAKPTSSPASIPAKQPAAASSPKARDGEAGRRVAPASVRAPQRPAAVDKVEVIDEVDEVQVVDEVDVVDESFVEESPRGRKSVRSGRADDSDLNIRRRRGDEDEERPRRKRRRKSSGMTGLVLACVGGISFMLMIVSGALMATTAPAVVAHPQQFGGNPGGGEPVGMVPGVPGGVNPGVPVGNAPAAGAINLVNGLYNAQDRLTRNDPADVFNKIHRAKRYSIQLTAGKSYTIEMASLERFHDEGDDRDFDPVLRVEHNGQVIVVDDDDGGYPHARIHFRPHQTGNYVIVATTYNPNVGSFRLQVREGP